MAVVSVNQNDFLKVQEVIDTRPGKPFSATGTRTYTRTFLVVTNHKELGSSYVCGARGIPRPFSVYQTDDGREYDVYAVLIDYDVSKKEADGHFHWTIRCNYSTEVPEEGLPLAGAFTEAEIGREVGGWQNEPWNRQPVFKWDWEETTYSPPADLDGRAFVNSARQPFSPPPTFPVARMILVVEQNEQFFDREIASLYAYAVNSDVFLGADPGTVQCMPIRCERKNLGPVPYFRNTYRLKFGLPKRAAPTTVPVPFVGDVTVPSTVTGLQSFQPEILDQGYSQIQRVGPHIDEPVPIWRPGGHMTQASLLDGAGRMVKPGPDGKIVPHFIRFRQFHSMLFAPILSGGVF